MQPITTPSWIDRLPDWAQQPVAYIAGIWNEGAFGLTYGEIGLAVLIILFALIIRGLFARSVVRGITKAAAGTDTQFDDALVEAIATPLKLVPVILGVYFALEVVDIDGQAAANADKAVQSVITLAVFWTLSRAVHAFEFLFTGLRDTLSPAIVDWMVKLLEGILLVLGFVAVAEIWGIAIAPIIAGLGIFGIAVGLGAQDLFKNLISGILIMTEKRFIPGEWIQVDGVVEGTVEQINFRSTLIKRFDKSPIYVPNGLLSDNPLTNFSRMTHRRIKWVIGVEYRTTLEQLRYIRDEIEALIWNDERFARPPEAALFVRINAFNDSSIDFLIYCFTHTTNWSEWLAIKEELATNIYEIVERAGTGFAFPSRTLYMQQQDAPEIITPPVRSEATLRALQERAAVERSGAQQDDDDG
ncbi:MAG: mechanosensitive ion channel family protein [Pseudomonadota bacterium]